MSNPSRVRPDEGTEQPAFPTTGRFSLDVRTGAWECDEEVLRIHGAVPGAWTATTENVLAAVTGAEDRQKIEDLLDRMIATSEAFSATYRLTGADDVDRTVLMVGERAVCDPTQVSHIDGYLIDLTDDLESELSAATAAAVEASAEHRAAIEQAKGALMLVYGFDEAAAFAMLCWWSRNRNIKLRDLCEELMRAGSAGRAAMSGGMLRIDRLLHDISSRHR